MLTDFSDLNIKSFFKGIKLYTFHDESYNKTKSYAHPELHQEQKEYGASEAKSKDNDTVGPELKNDGDLQIPGNSLKGNRNIDKADIDVKVTKITDNTDMNELMQITEKDKDDENIDSKNINPEDMDTDHINTNTMNKDTMDKNNMHKDNIDKNNMYKDNMDIDNMNNSNMDKRNMHNQKIGQERMEKRKWYKESYSIDNKKYNKTIVKEKNYKINMNKYSRNTDNKKTVSDHNDINNVDSENIENNNAAYHKVHNESKKNEPSDSKDHETATANRTSQKYSHNENLTICPIVNHTYCLQTYLIRFIDTILGSNSTLPIFLKHSKCNTYYNCVIKENNGIVHIYTETLLLNRTLSGHISYIVLMYLANCKSHQSYGHFTNGNRYIKFDQNDCFNLEQDEETMIKTGMKRSQYQILIFRKKLGCLVEKDMIERMVEMTDINSHHPSLGSMIKNLQLLNTINKGKLNENEIDLILEELDGRVSRLVSFYMRYCNPGMQMTSDNASIFQKGKLLRIEPNLLSNSVSSIMHLDNGYRGYMKLISQHDGDLRWRNQGAAEVWAHWVDRLLGLNLTPVAVMRNIYLTNLTCIWWEKEHMDCAPKNISSISLPMMARDDKRITNFYRQSVFYDITAAKHYIQVGVVLEVRNASFDTTFTTQNKNITLSQVLVIIGKYFSHELSLNDMKKSSCIISVQRLRDISDIHILDYLTVNEDRYVQKNWAESGTRLFAFDNGCAFWPSRTGVYHNATIRCIPVLCPEIPGQDVGTVLRFCRFNKDTIRFIKRLGPSAPHDEKLGVKLTKLMSSEHWPMDIKTYTYQLGINPALDKRVDILLDIHKECWNKYGRSIYI